MIKKKSTNKYHAEIINHSVHGKFDSVKEFNFFLQLLAQKKAVVNEFKVIDIVRQERYDMVINGLKIGFYKLDYKVVYANGKTRYFDVKGCKVGCAYQLFRLKKKIIESLYNIKIEEV